MHNYDNGNTVYIHDMNAEVFSSTSRRTAVFSML